MFALGELICRHLEPTLAMLAGCIDECPGDAWESPGDGVPVWEHVFHAAVWLDAWMRTPEQEFHAPAFFSHAALELEPGARPVVSREEMGAYLAQVAAKCRALLCSADDELLLRPAEIMGGRYALADQALGQFGHVMYHVGCVSAILRQRNLQAVPWAAFGEEG